MRISFFPGKSAAWWTANTCNAEQSNIWEPWSISMIYLCPKLYRCLHVIQIALVESFPSSCNNKVWDSSVQHYNSTATMKVFSWSYDKRAQISRHTSNIWTAYQGQEGWFKPQTSTICWMTRWSWTVNLPRSVLKTNRSYTEPSNAYDFTSWLRCKSKLTFSTEALNWFNQSSVEQRTDISQPDSRQLFLSNGKTHLVSCFDDLLPLPPHCLLCLKIHALPQWWVSRYYAKTPSLRPFTVALMGVHGESYLLSKLRGIKASNADPTYLITTTWSDKLDSALWWQAKIRQCWTTLCFCKDGCLWLLELSEGFSCPFIFVCLTLFRLPMMTKSAYFKQSYPLLQQMWAPLMRSSVWGISLFQEMHFSPNSLAG